MLAVPMAAIVMACLSPSSVFTVPENHSKPMWCSQTIHDVLGNIHEVLHNRIVQEDMSLVDDTLLEDV